MSSANAAVALAPEAILPSVAPGPAGPEPDPAVRMLSQAFTEHPQPAPIPDSTPAPLPPKPAVAAPPPATFAMVEPAQPSAFVQVTANGLVFPWWPTSFPARAAVWIVTLALVAAAAFGVAIASGRRLAA